MRRLARRTGTFFHVFFGHAFFNMFLLPVERFSPFSLHFYSFFGPSGPLKSCFLDERYCIFQQLHFFYFFLEFCTIFLNFALFLVDFGVFWLHLGSLGAPRNLRCSRARPPFFACFSSGGLRGRFGSLRGRFGSLRGWFRAHF